MALKFFLGDYLNYDSTFLTNKSVNQGAIQANRIFIFANWSPLRVCVIGVLLRLAKEKLFLRSFRLRLPP